VDAATLSNAKETIATQNPKKSADQRGTPSRKRRKQPDYRQRERFYSQRDYVKIKRNLYRRIRRALQGNVKSASTAELLGCSIEQLKRFLESHFTKEMRWDNYGAYWVLDHHIPCAVHNLADREQQKRCFHWSNLRPLQVKENLKKNDRHPSSGVRASRCVGVPEILAQQRRNLQRNNCCAFCHLR
jgi:AraC-like DNA-binding protein